MKRLLIFAVVAALSMTGSAYADTFGFGAITANSLVDPGIGEAQLSVDVTDPGASQVLFTFNNSGPAASSITDVYFDDGSLLGIASIVNSVGVNFSQGATPGNLPSGNTVVPPFVATAGFTADSNPPIVARGVNPGESLGILFNLQGGGTFADVLAELASGELRIGIHVQGFADGESESFIAPPPPDPGPGVPAPSTLVGLVSMAMVVMGRVFVRRNSAK
jgi:hypothetical protein